MTPGDRVRSAVVSTADLDIAYLETGPVDGVPVILLHGFPYDVHAYDAAADLLASHGYRCYIPYLRGYGATRFRSSGTMRSGQQAALGADLRAFLDALEIDAAVLAGYDWGGRAACIVAALWPDRARGLVSCGQGYNIQDIAGAGRPASPAEETRYWYQYYFHTPRGRAALTDQRAELCRFIWSLWSPTWRFDEATFRRSAAAFDNPDFVDIVVHSYTHRFGTVAGDPHLDDIEARLAEQPEISVPTVVLHGADDTVDPPSADNPDRRHFVGGYRRLVIGGAGHNLPQEAPEAFVAAVREVAQ